LTRPVSGTIPRFILTHFNSLSKILEKGERKGVGDRREEKGLSGYIEDKKKGEEKKNQLSKPGSNRFQTRFKENGNTRKRGKKETCEKIHKGKILSCLPCETFHKRIPPGCHVPCPLPPRTRAIRRIHPNPCKGKGLGVFKRSLYYVHRAIICVWPFVFNVFQGF
jgi:hypothetical protein